MSLILESGAKSGKRKGPLTVSMSMSTVLIENYRDKIVNHRKDLIKFAWHHLKGEEKM